MRQGSFSVQVPQGQEVGGGYVRMQHATRYSIKIGNHGTRRADAEVKIDGKFMGLFRINAGCYVDLDRPAHDKSCFTFFKSSSEEAGDAGVASVGREDRGLVVVTFKPEKTVHSLLRSSTPTEFGDDSGSWNRRRKGIGGQSVGGDREMKTCGGAVPAPECRAQPDMGMSRSMGFDGTTPTDVESGITGLTGRSDTDFVNVAELNYEPTLELPITLRLVADKAVRPLTEAPRGNPTPAAVE